MAKRILLADDSITIQKVVELTFSDGDYEVTAVNNGTKAIQALSQMKPDIILSDIIMPEKNGYEVCEFVKSHPEFRNIPVVLLTGTFEPFDPDRADKAGCDAVVTKPFESQNLIHKVEELISAAQSKSPAATESTPPPAPPPPSASQFATGVFQPQSSEIFATSTPPPPPPSTPSDTPFADMAAPTGETRAFPKLSADELQQLAREASELGAPPPSPQRSPWDEKPVAGGETRAFPKMNFEEMPAPAAAPPPPPPPSSPEPSPWSEAPAPPSSETRAFPAIPAEPPWEPPSAAAAAPEPKTFPRAVTEEPAQSSAAEEAPLRGTPAAGGSDLTDEQIDRIARRVVELMSEQLVRNIAWEVIPDVAEMVVKERIRQLESEA